MSLWLKRLWGFRAGRLWSGKPAGRRGRDWLWNSSTASARGPTSRQCCAN